MARNIGSHKTEQLGIPKMDRNSETVRLGFLDYQLGNGFPKDYDTWHETKQLNYENGRQMAALCVPLDLDVDWFPSQTFGKAVSLACDSVDQMRKFHDEYAANNKITLASSAA